MFLYSVPCSVEAGAVFSHTAVHIKHTSAHIDTSALFSMPIEYWILTCKVLDPVPAISAYSAIFPLSSAAIWHSVANHQAPLYVPMCADAFLYWPATPLFTESGPSVRAVSKTMDSLPATSSDGLLTVTCRAVVSTNVLYTFTLHSCKWSI